jgi:hypothetical protein
VLGSTSTMAPLAMERFDGLGVKIGDSKRRKNKFLSPKLRPRALVALIVGRHPGSLARSI